MMRRATLTVESGRPLTRSWQCMTLSLGRYDKGWSTCSCAVQMKAQVPQAEHTDSVFHPQEAAKSPSGQRPGSRVPRLIGKPDRLHAVRSSGALIKSVRDRGAKLAESSTCGHPLPSCLAHSVL